MPGVGATVYNHSQPKRSNSSVTSQNESPQHPRHQSRTSQPPQFFPPNQPFNLFPTSNQQMPPPMLQDRAMSSSSFPQHSPMTPSFALNTQGTMQSPPIGQDQPMTSSPWTGMPGTIFDEQSLLNFDTSNMNFANNYGALEFGMLGHMATNAGDTPPSDSATTRGSVHQPFSVPLGSFSESPNNNSFPYNDAMMSDWSNGSVYGMHGPGQAPHAFAIETNPQFHSPENHPTPPDGLKFEDSPLLTSTALKQAAMDMSRLPLNSLPPPKQRQPSGISTPQLKARSQLPVKSNKKPRDPSCYLYLCHNPTPIHNKFSRAYSIPPEALL